MGQLKIWWRWRSMLPSAGEKIGICRQAPSDHHEFDNFLVERGINSISLDPDAVIQKTPHILETETKLIADAIGAADL
jgi:phosphoenolpyruvate synthase/pyruvate phosphate dikinase